MTHAALRRLAVACALTVSALLAPARLSAQGGFMWQGLVDLEGWKTDSASRLLARGSGKPAVLARVDTWAAIEPITNFILFGELLGEAGPARDEEGSEIYVKQAGLRWLPSDAFTLQLGRVTQIVGTFAGRQQSTRNPLIGIPDGYAASYPDGARIDGNIGIVDYRAGVLSLPVWRDGYTPDPSKDWHPAAGLGITPFTGLRIGVSGTYGSYLNDSLTVAQLRGQSWKSYKERILAGDAQFSIGYFEAHAEAARGTYEVPGVSARAKGFQYYLESKYTFDPRFFVAARYERNDYPFIRPFGNFWVANNNVLCDAEFGGGFRVNRNTLVKASLRKDWWAPNANPQAPHDNGYAVVFQLTQSFDVVELFTREQ